MGGQEKWEGRRSRRAGVGEQEDCKCRRKGRQEEWDDRDTGGHKRGRACGVGGHEVRRAEGVGGHTRCEQELTKIRPPIVRVKS